LHAKAVAAPAVTFKKVRRFIGIPRSNILLDALYQIGEGVEANFVLQAVRRQVKMLLPL